MPSTFRRCVMSKSDCDRIAVAHPPGTGYPAGQRREGSRLDRDALPVGRLARPARFLRGKTKVG
eukprot:9484217-Pyramimonas_sp.AAC.2